MPPQPRSGIKPDPTMFLCYVPDLVFALIHDAPFFPALCSSRPNNPHYKIKFIKKLNLTTQVEKVQKTILGPYLLFFRFHLTQKTIFFRVAM